MRIESTSKCALNVQRDRPAVSLALLHWHLLNVREGTDGYKHLTAIGQTHQHLAATIPEVQVLDTHVNILHLAHLSLSLADSSDSAISTHC